MIVEAVERRLAEEGVVVVVDQVGFGRVRCLTRGFDDDLITLRLVGVHHRCRRDHDPAIALDYRKEGIRVLTQFVGQRRACRETHSEQKSTGWQTG